MTVERAQPTGRKGTVLFIALGVMLAVAMLAAQGMRLMSLVNNSHQQQLHQSQMEELLELGRLRLNDRSQPETFTVAVPGKPGWTGNQSRLARITIDKLTDRAEHWRVVVEYPAEVREAQANQPQSSNSSSRTTATWEGPHD